MPDFFYNYTIRLLFKKIITSRQRQVKLDFNFFTIFVNIAKTQKKVFAIT